MPERMSEYNPNNMSDGMPERMSDIMPKYMSVEMSDRMPFLRIPNKMSDRTANRMMPDEC